MIRYTANRVYPGLVLLLAGGCGGNPPAGLVEGTARLNGKPLTHAQVMFLPAGGGPLASGYTDAAGRYSLTMEATGTPGVAAGRCAVLVRDLAGWGGADAPARPRVPARYATAADSPLAAEVAAGGPHPHDFDLTAP